MQHLPGLNCQRTAGHTSRMPCLLPSMTSNKILSIPASRMEGRGAQLLFPGAPVSDPAASIQSAMDAVAPARIARRRAASKPLQRPNQKVRPNRQRASLAFPGFRPADGPRPQRSDRHEDLALLSALIPIFPLLSPPHPPRNSASSAPLRLARFPASTASFRLSRNDSVKEGSGDKRRGAEDTAQRCAESGPVRGLERWE